MRQSTIDALCEAFADDRLALAEFERRVDTAHATSSLRELQALTADLPAPERAPDGPASRRRGDRPRPGSDVARPTRPLPADPESMPEQAVLAGVLGGATRRGGWTPAHVNWAVAVMGGVKLDLRDVPLPPGVTEIRAFAFWGGVEVLAPPDVRVECSGIGLLGGFDERRRAAPSHDPDAPVVRVTGFACMGGVTVEVRHPGETARQARRRIKKERASLDKRSHHEE